MTNVLALDLGTTGTRAVLFDENGNIIGSAYKEWVSFYPSPAEVEQDASTWWDATREIIAEVLEKTRVNTEDIQAVAVTNQRETIVPVNENGDPLANAIVWQDRRTSQECQFIRDAIGKDAIYKKTGLTIDPYFSASKILWFKNNRPQVYENATKFLLVHDFIVKKLTGSFVTDFSNASRTMLFDINTRAWSEDILAALDIDQGKLPDVVAPGTQVGCVSPDAGTGLESCTVVVAGAGDQQCAALGVGVTEQGRVKCTMGTGTFLIAYAPSVKLDPGTRVLCSCSAIENSYVVEASMFSTGSLLRWARDTVGHAECDEAIEVNLSPYQVIDQKAEASPVGSNGLLFLPFIVGAGAPYWNPDARGTLFGLAAGHQRGDIYRSIMEGTSFDVRKNMDVFSEMELAPSELRLTGGGSRSRIWSQILADACNVPCIRPKYEESTAVGAALLASVGAGLFNDVSKAANEFIQVKDQLHPDPSTSNQYERIMTIYTKLYETLNASGLFTDLQAFR
ncbi:MAG TPA: xylulokinase [Candidatus Lokiarchaeia archaeon]|nr:xylulokinase [Candidatus Lokiarchaeia archaeon]